MALNPSVSTIAVDCFGGGHVTRKKTGTITAPVLLPSLNLLLDVQGNVVNHE